MSKCHSKLNIRKRYPLYLEALESRQLLATVWGGGEEVGSDIAFQGNTYDQVLMTGGTVIIEADPGQIVRTSYLDGNGDILQAEFSGRGRLSIILDEFLPPAEAVKYNQPGVEYVTGQASFSIEGSDATTNFSLHTVGPVTSTVWNNLMVEGVEYDGVADATRVTIIADPSTLDGSSFGGIRMANSFLSGDVGIVGISAINVHVVNKVVVGDIDAGGAAVPSLRFGDDSTFETVLVAGGDLDQTSNLSINGSNFDIIEFVDGTTSYGKLINATEFLGKWAGEFSPITITLDNTINPIDITGRSQFELNSIFLSSSFKNDIIILGDLPSQNNISVAEFHGSVTFDGVYDGAISIIRGIGGDLIFSGVASDPDNPGAGDRTINSDFTLGEAIEGNVTFGAENVVDAVNFSGTLSAASIGNIDLHGDFSGLITTDLDGDKRFDEGESTVGAFSVFGDYSGSTIGILGIGNALIEGNLTTTSATGATAFYTSSNTADPASFADIGNLTIEGDVDQSNSSDKLIEINRNGNFGDVIISGGGNLGNSDGSDFLSLGAIITGGLLGDDNITGTLTIEEGTSDLELLGIAVNNGNLDNIVITGSGAPDTNLLITGALGGFETAINDITFTGFQTIEQDANIIGLGVGNISYTTNDPTAALNTLIDLDKFIVSRGAVGNLLLDAGESNSSVDVAFNFIDADGGNDSIGTIDIIAETITLGQINADEIGSISFTGTTEINDEITANVFDTIRVDGDISFTDGGAFVSKQSLGSFEVIGDTTFDNPGFKVADTGFLIFGGDVVFDIVGPSIIADDGTSALDVIDGVIFGGSVTGGFNFDIQASAIGDITIIGQLEEGEIYINQLGVAASNNSGSGNNAETVALDGSNLSDYTIGKITINTTNFIGAVNNSLFDGDSYFQALGAIGDISISAGGSSLLQTALFNDSTAEVDFIVGNGNLGNTSDAGIDFDGDGTIGGTTNNASISLIDEETANFTSGVVSIGNVTVNAARLGLNNNDTVLAVSQFLVLSGVESPSGAIAFDGNFDSAVPNDPASSVQVIDDDLQGTIGDVFIANSNLQLSFATTTASVTLDGVSAAGGIFASSSIGLVQSVDHGASLDQAGEGILIGNNNTETAANLGDDEVIVMIV